MHSLPPATEYLSFDILGRVTRSRQTTDGIEYGGGSDPSSWMTYTYDLSAGDQLIETVFNYNAKADAPYRSK